MVAGQKESIPHDIIRNSTILIVDDSETTRMILRSFCQKAGFTHIHEAENGQEALEFIRRTPTDLVFLDMEMPVMDGLLLCYHLRIEMLLDKLVIIMQTASDKPELKAKAFEAGVTDLISKPLEARETVARMLAHLERQYLHRKSEEDYRRIQEELTEAVVLQNILLPHEELLTTIKRENQLDVTHYYHPASELAGDYISVRKLPDNRLALIAVDVSGHGLTAALYSFSIHTLLSDSALASQSPAQVLAMLNDKLHDFMSAGKFATALIAIVDTNTKTIEYASAASPPPILLRANGEYQVLESRGHLLGVDGSVQFENHHLSYEKGDVLFIYSDALIESPNSSTGACMTEEEIAKALASEGAKSNSDARLKKVMMSFYSGYTYHPADDLSMIVCSFL